MLRAVADAGELARSAAGEILRLSGVALAERGVFHLALSGGSTPRATYAELARLTRAADLSRWHVWFGDERCVLPDDARSNFRLARDSWLAGASLPADQVHRMRGEDAPALAAERYERELFSALGDPPRLDLVLLGLGADGHTASLFPGSPALHEAQAFVVPARADQPPYERVTLTSRAINAAREVLFLVAGAEKAEALGALLAQQGSPDELPALLVRPQGRVLWLADRAALARTAPELVAALRE